MKKSENNDITLGEVEFRFAEIIWNSEPLSSGELVQRCEAALEWKKSTTYTVLRKLCDRGLFVNENGTVRSLISREEYFSRRSESFVEETFNGSLPAFVAAFTQRKKLSKNDIEELSRLIAEARTENEVK